MAYQNRLLAKLLGRRRARRTERRAIVALDALEGRALLSRLVEIEHHTTAEVQHHGGGRQGHTETETHRGGGQAENETEHGAEVEDHAPGREAEAERNGQTETEVHRQAEAEHRQGGQVEVEAARGRSGMVTKRPHFYEFFVGGKRRDLNVMAASARLIPNRGLVLTGTMQGKINRTPTSEATESYFVWGINRGSSKAVTPFFQREGVRFDAVVVVSAEQDGITGFVRDFETGQRTEIDPSAIRVRGHQVTVTVDPTRLPTPAGGVPLSQAAFNLWPRDSLDNSPLPNNGSHVASFIPENAMAPIGAPRSGRA